MTNRMYLENIEEFVNDQDKVVTYKWLSRTLSVSANQAKRMLYEFVQSQGKTKPVDVTYLVSGIRSSVKEDETTVSQYVALVSEDHLDELKECLSPVLSVHIYSVQKSKLKDCGPLYTADFELQKEELQLSYTNKWSSIVCKAAAPSANRVRKPAAEADKYYQKTAERPIAKAKSPISKSSKESSSISRIGARVEAVRSEQGQKEVKKDVKKNSKKDSKKDSKAETTAVSFFGRPTKKKAVKAPVKESVEPKELLEKETEKIGKEEDKSKKRKKDDVKSEAVKKTSKRKAKESQPVDYKGSKRKRAVILESDSEEEGSHQSEDPAPEIADKIIKVDAEEAAVPMTVSSSSSSSTSKRKRTKKMKSKTYVNDDGEFVTEKVYESCSTDASDVEMEPPKPSHNGSTNTKSTPRQTAKPHPNKQSSLMNFLKKS